MSKNLPTNNIPVHVAIIMDGNGRWAKARGLPRIMGHKQGAEALRSTLEACRKSGIKYLTIYAFSSENWKRPVIEVSDLMELLRTFLDKEVAALHKNGIKLRVIGDTSKLANDIRSQITTAEELTKDNKEFNLIVALSYGARQEIIHAAQELVKLAISGKIPTDKIDESAISSLLYTNAIPDPDLLIRTAGEQRLSNFLLWQSAYTELYFTPILWPDFTPGHLQEAISEYSNRERRYGTTS